MDNQAIRQAIRAWLAQRQARAEPLPSPEEIRRVIGWPAPARMADVPPSAAEQLHG